MVFLGILSGSNSLRFLEACADVHNAKETIYNWEDTETQGTTAYNRHERAPSSGLPKVGTTDHKRTPATLQLNGLLDRLTHVQLYSSPTAVHVKPLIHVLGEHFSLHRFELTKSPMYVDISFRNCVLAKRTLFMAMTVYFAVEKNEALLSQLPASSPMCRLGLFPLLAITAKGWHSPTGSRIQQVPSTNTHNGLPCISLARVFRPRRAYACGKMIEFRSRTAPPPYGWKPFLSHSLNQFLILSIHHDFLDHFCSWIATLAINFVKLRLQVSPVLASTPTRAQLQAFVWRNNGSGQRYMDCASLGFSNPDILETRIFPQRT